MPGWWLAAATSPAAPFAAKQKDAFEALRVHLRRYNEDVVKEMRGTDSRYAADYPSPPAYPYPYSYPYPYPSPYYAPYYGPYPYYGCPVVNFGFGIGGYRGGGLRSGPHR